MGGSKWGREQEEELAAVGRQLYWLLPPPPLRMRLGRPTLLPHAAGGLPGCSLAQVEGFPGAGGGGCQAGVKRQELHAKRASGAGRLEPAVRLHMICYDVTSCFIMGTCE